MSSAKQPIKILHICQDEKFMDGVTYLFEKAFPSSNTFLVLMPPANPPLKYIANTTTTVLKVVYGKNSSSEIKKIEKKFDKVILHGLNYRVADLVISSAKKEKFVWSLLGAELYQNNLLYAKPLFGKKTTLMVKHLEGGVEFKERIKNVYRKLRYRNLPKIDNAHKLVAKAASQITQLGSLFQEEFDYLIKNKLIASRATYQPLTYYPIEYFADNTDTTPSSQLNILVGNSASFTNNHLEVFDLLKFFDLANRKIIVPLSYGNLKYQKKIIEEGITLFGKQFVPLVKFMNLREYNKVIDSCSIGIMNHYRQQGVGNILQSLWQGRKVYLSEKNVLFTYFTRINCLIFSVEKELNADNFDALKMLTTKEVEHNRLILKNEISEKVLIENLRSGLMPSILNK